jgi:type VI secretion system protein ImpG
MDKLLHHYERELGRLREAARQYAAIHPSTAESLELNAGTSTDPEVERLLQSVALLNAAMQQLIEQGRGAFHHALLQSLQPHYLRAVPACAIVHVDTRSTEHGEKSTVSRMARGTILRAGTHRYTTSHDVFLAPIAIDEARFHPTIDVPATLRLPGNARSDLVISLRTTASSVSFDQPPLSRLRIHVDQNPALLDAILMRSLCVCLEAEGSWQLLPSSPLSLAGTSQDESLLPCHPGQQSARLLTEFFHLPAKFHFIDVDLAAISKNCPQGCRRIALHIVLPNCDERLRRSRAATLRLSCAPVINAFPQTAAPIRLDGRTEAYPLAPQAGCEIYSIDSVAVVNHLGDNVLPPFHGTEHTQPGPYWQLDEQEGPAFRLVDREQRPASPKFGTATVQLLCTNTDPLHPQAKLKTESSANGSPIQFLHEVTAPKRLADPALLCGGIFSADISLPALRQLLRMHGCQYADSLKELAAKPATAWIEHPMGRIHMQGIEFTVTLDEPALQEHSIYVLAEILAHVLSDKLRENRFAQLRFVNDKGEPLCAMNPRVGTRPIT